MGIKVIEGETNNNCPSCFGTDNTPVLMYLTITGVQKGTGWISSMGLPPNGVHILEGTGGCRWVRLTVPTEIALDIDGPANLLVVGIDLQPIMFAHTGFPDCSKNFVNQFTTPASNEFFGGTAALTYTSPTTGASLLHVAELVQIPQDAKTFAEVFPFDSTQSIYRYARKKDATLAKIKFDFTV